jgi:hypothetical protein
MMRPGRVAPRFLYVWIGLGGCEQSRDYCVLGCHIHALAECAFVANDEKMPYLAIGLLA